MIAIAVWWLVMRTGPPLPEGVTPQQFTDAAAWYRENYGTEPDHESVLSVLAEQMLQNDEQQSAVACFDAIPDDHPVYGASARLQQGQLLYRLDRAVEAEAHLKQFLKLEQSQPQSTRRERVVAIEHLRYLLGVQLRLEEQRELIRPTLQWPEASGHNTVLYCFPSLMNWTGSESIRRLERFLRHDPHNIPLRIALGRYRTTQGKLDEALSVLEACRAEDSDNLAATAALLRCLKERGDSERHTELMQQLPLVDKTDPWLLTLERGHFANHQDRPDDAISSFNRMLEIDPANAEAWTGLARAYQLKKQFEQSTDAQRKGQVLARIQNRIGWIQEQKDQVRPVIEIAELCREIGLDDHALAVARIAQRLNPKDTRVTTMLAELAGDSQ